MLLLLLFLQERPVWPRKQPTLHCMLRNHTQKVCLAQKMRVLLRIVSKYFVSTPDSRVSAMRPVRAISSTPAAETAGRAKFQQS